MVIFWLRDVAEIWLIYSHQNQFKPPYQMRRGPGSLYPLALKKPLSQFGNIRLLCSFQSRLLSLRLLNVERHLDRADACGLKHIVNLLK
jgi:hypothetical protein